MWENDINALICYTEVMCIEWTSRYFTDSIVDKIQEYKNPEITYTEVFLEEHDMMPTWLGNDDFHTSHQSNLLRKDKEHYSVWFRQHVPENLPYIWPGRSKR